MEVNIYILIVFGIMIVGAGIALFLALRGYGKAKGIQHYEDIRDKLTVREPEPELLILPERSSRLGLSHLIGGFVAILIGVTLLPEVGKAVSEAQINNSATLTPLTTATLPWLPVFLALVIVVIAILMIVGRALQSLNQAGLV